MSANSKSEKSFMEQYGSLKENDRIRGSTPADLASRCLAICQTYIGGSWTLAKDASEVEVQRITGGLTNQLYSVQLLDSVPTARNEVYPNEPRKVAVKLFQKKLINPSFGQDGENERLSDVVVLTLLSAAEVSPKVYGIFDDANFTGYVQTFYEHSQYRPVHQQNPKLQAKVAQLLATTHNLKVPIAKTNKWLLEMIRNSLRDAYEVDGIAASIETLGLENLAKRDIRLEFSDLLVWMADVKASYFCHNDFRRGNILVVQDSPCEETVKLVDFEYCSFGFRGFDLASFLLEWGREKFDKRPIQMPSDEVIESFIKLYTDACNEVEPGFSLDPDNALEKIVLETKKCMLFNYFFLMSFILQQKEAFIKGMPFSKETNLKFVEELCKTYYTIKGQLVEQGVITKKPF